MIPKISSVKPEKDYTLMVEFDSGEAVLYDVSEDIDSIPEFEPLRTIPGLFDQVQLDQSRTVVFWNDMIDLPSDTILEFGKLVR